MADPPNPLRRPGPPPPKFTRRRMRVAAPGIDHPAGDEEVVINPDPDDYHTTTTTTVETCTACGAAMHEPKEVGGVCAVCGLLACAACARLKCALCGWIVCRAHAAPSPYGPICRTHGFWEVLKFAMSMKNGVLKQGRSQS